MQKEVGERRGACGHAGVWGKRVDKDTFGKGSRVAEEMVEKKMYSSKTHGKKERYI